jgi:hypothetical protein
MLTCGILITTLCSYIEFTSKVFRHLFTPICSTHKTPTREKTEIHKMTIYETPTINHVGEKDIQQI